VTAVVEGDKVHGHVGQLVRPIVPAVAKARKENPGLAGKTLIPAAIKANVLQALEDLLRKSKIVREKVRDGKVKLVGAIYDLETGKVEIMGPHPAQAGLLGANPPAPKSAK
jgi:carbonic anhydrase